MPVSFTKYGQDNKNACQILAVSDVYEKRKRTQVDQVRGKRVYRLPGIVSYAGD